MNRAEEFSVKAPSSTMRAPRVHLYWQMDDSQIEKEQFELELLAQSQDGERILRAVSTTLESRGDESLNHTVFELDEWRDLLSLSEPGTIPLTIRGRVLQSGNAQAPEVPVFRYVVSADEYYPEVSDEISNGEWLIWQ